MILISVDLPAPFSPISAVTAPPGKSSVTSCSARTPANRLEIRSTRRVERRGAGATSVMYTSGRDGPEAAPRVFLGAGDLGVRPVGVVGVVAVAAVSLDQAHERRAA